MATIVLQAAGAFLGGVFGPIGSAIGSAVGAMAGYALDRGLIESTRRVEGPRLGAARPFAAEEGAPIARVYGTARVGGNIIWATRFEEASTTERQGGKGGPRVTTYSYFCNAAFALCEGEIAGIRRIWADGREIDLSGVDFRVHPGSEDQPVDPLIAAKQGEGNAPAYRGVAYVVFERFAIGDFGNRIPQFQFEVMRPLGALHGQVRSVALLPGSTEYGLSPTVVRRLAGPGETEFANRNVLHAPSDLIASLDELQALCPNLEEVAVVVAWFGDDLRAGECGVTPRVTRNDGSGLSAEWSVSGVPRATARVVSTVGGALAYGGTPSDRSVIDCIAELKSRGLRVALYPFLMMDVAPGNGLANPHGDGEQPAFPWRGRITCHPAAGRDGTTDGTSAARDQIEAFCGAVQTEHFAAGGGTVTYLGPANDFGYRRQILHYAHLAVAAGGVDTFLIGSELRGLTTVRDGTGAFPFVEALCALAADVRTVLGSGAGITYGADWSEYFGYQPADGSGDVLFHLDPLWSHEAISAVGIDNYMPLADWRDGDHAGGNPDGFRFPDDPAGLRSQIAGGEGHDWYYPDDEARRARIRAPITDGAYGKPWVFRNKDLRSWWENEHHERIGGVEASTPTTWTPRSKPIWMTELGYPAIDKGANQPNVFVDAQSSEGAVPHFSNGGRSDLMQKRFLEAHFAHWSEAAGNPVSELYGDRMVDPSRICVWAWDGRPYPAFPRLRGVWSDGANWHRGHWLSGRMGAVAVDDLVRAILDEHGFADVRVDPLPWTLEGFVIDAPSTARSALEPLAGLLGLGVFGEAGTIVVRSGSRADASVLFERLAIEDGRPAVERVRAAEHELASETELRFVDPSLDYQAGLVRVAAGNASGAGLQSVAIPAVLDGEAARAMLVDRDRRDRTGRETVGFRLPASGRLPRPGDLIRLPDDIATGEFLVTEVEGGTICHVAARAMTRRVPTAWRSRDARIDASPPAVAGAPHVAFLDLPMMPGATLANDQLRLAVFARPWRAQSSFVSPDDTGFELAGTVTRPATIGELSAPLPPGHSGRLQHAGGLAVRLYGGELASVSLVKLLGGANLCAIRALNGAWELLQFRQAEEIEPGHWLLTTLLRGQLGTEDAMDAGAATGAAFVLIDAAVAKAGLPAELTGLPLNWRIGPAGGDFGGDDFVAASVAGGIRSQLPLSPVHLRAARDGAGDVAISWVRRGRLDADSWQGDDIPLGEDFERYRVEIRDGGGELLRMMEADAPHVLYAQEDLLADVAELPATVTVTVRQLSAAIGAGLAASRNFTIR